MRLDAVRGPYDLIVIQSHSWRSADVVQRTEVRAARRRRLQEDLYAHPVRDPDLAAKVLERVKRGVVLTAVVQ